VSTKDFVPYLKVGSTLTAFPRNENARTASVSYNNLPTMVTFYLSLQSIWTISNVTEKLCIHEICRSWVYFL